jgi:acetate kinase
MPQRKVITDGKIERIGKSDSKLTRRHNEETFQREIDVACHYAGVILIMESILDDLGVNKSDIIAVGHRVVHGAACFDKPVIIDKNVIKIIRKLTSLAPLHNSPALQGVEAAQNKLKDIPHIACFDTAFHQTIPQRAFMYGLPWEFYEEKGIRKFGFHGISHQYITRETARLFNNDKPNIISCHLGNGCSVTAVKNGKSVDTSMGFTPLEGLMMGTRPGDFDPAVILHLETQGYDRQQLDDICNKQSGLLGVSGISNDVRDLVIAAKKGNLRAELAIDIFCYRIKKYIGAYMAVLGSVDAVVFTGGIGENSSLVRKKVCQDLNQFQVEIDKKNTDENQQEISTSTSKTKILVIPTNEELEIASGSFELVKERIPSCKIQI